MCAIGCVMRCCRTPMEPNWFPRASRPHAGLAARTVVYYVLGFTVDEQSRLQWDAAGALAEGQSVLTEDPSARFAFGLGLLVDGIAAHSRSLHAVGEDGVQGRD